METKKIEFERFEDEELIEPVVKEVLIMPSEEDAAPSQCEDNEEILTESVNEETDKVVEDTKNEVVIPIPDKPVSETASTSNENQTTSAPEEVLTEEEAPTPEEEAPAEEEREELIEIEVDEDAIVAYIVDEDDNEIGFIIEEDGEEVEYYYADEEETSSFNPDEEVIAGITKGDVANFTKGANEVFRDTTAVVVELKDAYSDIMDAFKFKK